MSRIIASGFTLAWAIWPTTPVTTATQRKVASQVGRSRRARKVFTGETSTPMILCRLESFMASPG